MNPQSRSSTRSATDGDALVKKLEHAVSLVLLALMAVVVALATLELGVTIAKDVFAPPLLFVGIDRLLDIFGKFLVVLIGIELLETMRAFAFAGEIRAKVVLTVAMIALARKIIILEPEHTPTTTMLGIAGVLVALAVVYKIFVRD
jgi:uncharacterized membrane protein (DUF373 family)